MLYGVGLGFIGGKGEREREGRGVSSPCLGRHCLRRGASWWGGRRRRRRRHHIAGRRHIALDDAAAAARRLQPQPAARLRTCKCRGRGGRPSRARPRYCTNYGRLRDRKPPSSDLRAGMTFGKRYTSPFMARLTRLASSPVEEGTAGEEINGGERKETEGSGRGRKGVERKRKIRERKKEGRP